MMHHPMSALVGSDCGMVAAAGMGSFHAMAMEPVVTAASHNPLITTFAGDVTRAGLAPSLNSATAITVFAPDNAAFAKLHGSAMRMLGNHMTAAEILKYHVVRGHITPADLKAGQHLRTLQGGAIVGSKMGSVYEINNASVTCGNFQAGKATVYIINTVLLPGHMH